MSSPFPLFPVVPRKVVIIGAGAAGVFTAYLLKKFAPGCFDVTLLEKNDTVGGHTISFQKTAGGMSVNIDAGAQFFWETTQPDYCAMLRAEGFFNVPGRIIERDVGITIWDDTNSQVLFRVPPTLPGILAAAVTDVTTWLNFLSLTLHAIYHYRFGSWSVLFGDWLDSVSLVGSPAEQAAFKADIARPLMYQFGLVRPQRLDSLSARFVVWYYVRSLPWLGGSSPFRNYNSDIGLDGILRELLTMYGITPTLNATVETVEQVASGYRVRLDDGTTTFDADEVVFATNPQWTKGLLPTDTSFDTLRNLLDGMEYLPVPVFVQDASVPTHMPSAGGWAVSNVLVAKDSAGAPTNYMLSVWFGPLRTESIAATVFKSWGSPHLLPAGASADFEQVHQLMVGTPDFIARREQLRSQYQGQDNLWYVGGYIVDYDCQNSALRSAASVARRLIYDCWLQSLFSALPMTSSAAPSSSSTPSRSPTPTPMHAGVVVPPLHGGVSVPPTHGGVAVTPSHGGAPPPPLPTPPLQDQDPFEGLRGAQFRELPPLLEEIERVIVARQPRHASVREWLDLKRRRGLRQP